MYLKTKMKKSIGVKIFLSGIVLGISLAGAADTLPARKSAKATTPKPVPSKTKAAGQQPQQQGMSVSRDTDGGGGLQSGKLNPAEPSAARQLIGAEPQAVQLPNGMFMVPASSEHMSSSIVTRNADGSVNRDCVEGVAKAEAIVKKAGQRQTAKQGGSK